SACRTSRPPRPTSPAGSAEALRGPAILLRMGVRSGAAAATKRLLLETLGWVLIVAGLAALVLPGPGLLLLFAGLAVLSQQYDWAERRMHPVREAALRGAA